MISNTGYLTPSFSLSSAFYYFYWGIKSHQNLNKNYLAVPCIMEMQVFIYILYKALRESLFIFLSSLRVLFFSINYIELCQCFLSTKIIITFLFLFWFLVLWSLLGLKPGMSLAFNTNYLENILSTESRETWGKKLWERGLKYTSFHCNNLEIRMKKIL